MIFCFPVVKFGHRSMFPVLFDGEAINKWWRSALIFKVYSKFPSQKVVSATHNFKQFTCEFLFDSIKTPLMVGYIEITFFMCPSSQFVDNS